MKYLKTYKLFEKISIDDILEELYYWNIDYYWYVENFLLEILFRYPDRVNNYEIDTINKVISKISNLKTIRIVSGYDFKMVLKEEQLKGLKVPNGVKVITGFYNIMKQYHPEINEYFDDLFSNVELLSSKIYIDSIFYVKNNEIIVQHQIDKETIWTCKEIWDFFNKFELNVIEKENIIRDIIKHYLNIENTSVKRRLMMLKPSMI